MTVRPTVMILFAAALCLAGCETDLDAAYDDFRAQAPTVCKDYCEERTACHSEVGAGPMEDDYYSSQIRQCTAECAAYASEGAYVWVNSVSSMYNKFYTDYIPGDTLIAGIECMYNIGAYRCVDTTGNYFHQFNPPVKSVCDQANECLAGYGIDYYVFWRSSPDGFGGSCEAAGTQSIEAIFF